MSIREQQGFYSAPIAAGPLFEGLFAQDGIEINGWRASVVELSPDATHFGVQTVGEGVLSSKQARPAVGLAAGMFFVHPSIGKVVGDAGVVISVRNYQGLFQVGGPLEPTGRLRYIDGCSDTLLVAPPRHGDPCLNHLHVPPNTRQTMHTHPSLRVGVIISGCGECRTPEGVHPLAPGIVWIIPAGSRHAFETRESALDVIAWHPDSDFGPTDEVHPMINRTEL